VLFVDLRHSKKVELTFFDVGQGDSTLLKFPNGKTMLVDGGGSRDETWDPGSTRVVPALRASGVKHLDWVVATHPHADHVAGLRAVLKSISVGELWICWHDQPDTWLHKLLSIARERNIRILRPRKIHSGAVTIQPLWPRGFETFCGDPGYSANDNSIVLRVEYGQAAILLTGDIEEPVEHALTQEQQTARLLRADLLKVPHHGSPTSSTDQLLEAVSPRLAVISCGSGNLFGLPDLEVIKRYRRNGIQVARTDRLGAIRVLLGKDGQLEWSAATSWTR
jgi:competence protein ComEC